MAGDDYILIGSTTADPKLFRYFADTADFAAFRTRYGMVVP